MMRMLSSQNPYRWKVLCDMVKLAHRICIHHHLHLSPTGYKVHTVASNRIEVRSYGSHAQVIGLMQ